MSALCLTPVVRALCDLVEDRCRVLTHRARPWASITFAGSRHEIELLFRGDEEIAMGEAMLEALPEQEFAIAGKLVADASVLRIEQWHYVEPRLTATIELLVLDDA